MQIKKHSSPFPPSPPSFYCSLPSIVLLPEFFKTTLPSRVSILRVSLSPRNSRLSPPFSHLALGKAPPPHFPPFPPSSCEGVPPPPSPQTYNYKCGAPNVFLSPPSPSTNFSEPPIPSPRIPHPLS